MEESLEDYTRVMRGRHARRTGEQGRSVLLDEYSQSTGLERRHANKVLREWSLWNNLFWGTAAPSAQGAPAIRQGRTRDGSAVKESLPAPPKEHENQGTHGVLHRETSSRFLKCVLVSLVIAEVSCPGSRRRVRDNARQSVRDA